jgi:hypothetical protein
MSALGTVDDALTRVIDEALERRLRPLVAELAELRAALQARGSTLSARGTPWATLPAIRLASPPRRKRTTRSASSSEGMFFGEVFEVETARSRARESSRSDAA